MSRSVTTVLRFSLLASATGCAAGGILREPDPRAVEEVARWIEQDWERQREVEQALHRTTIDAHEAAMRTFEEMTPPLEPPAP